MKTECPHCQARFKALDKYEGKKVKCPKCKQLFVITQFVETTSVQLCARCGRKIGKLEQACVFQGAVVCSECDQNLRKSAEVSTTQVDKEETRVAEEKLEVPLQIPEPGEEIEWLPLRRASKAGIIVAALLIFGGISLLFKNPPKRTQPTFKDQPGLLGMYDSLSLSTIRETTSSLIEQEAELERFGNVICGGAILGIGLCLLMRVFLPEITFLRIILTVFGGFLVGFPIAIVIFAVVRLGLRVNFGPMLLVFAELLLGVVLLRYAFRPKVFRWFR